MIYQLVLIECGVGYCVVGDRRLTRADPAPIARLASCQHSRFPNEMTQPKYPPSQRGYIDSLFPHV